jgi:superfamily II DNA or RNA helicase
MADFEIVIDNTWTHLKPNVKLNTELIRRIESEMSYSREEYSNFRKETFELEIPLFERERLRYPTGLYSTLDRILSECHFSFDVLDTRIIPSIGDPLQMHAKKLRDYQEEVVHSAIKAERGVIKVATGGGKTVIAAAIVAQLNLKTLFIVYSIDLLEQTADEFENMFKIKVGKIGGGYCDIRQINVCTVQTLHSAFDLKYSAIDEENMFKEKISKHVLERKHEIRKVVQEAEVVISDECHRATAPVYIQMMQLMQSAYFRYSLSATPYRDKSIDKVLDAYSGRQICNISASFLIDKGYLVQPWIYMLDPNEHPKYKYVRKSFRNIYEEYIVNNDLRNEMIIDSTLRLLELGKSVLITVTRLPHGDILCERLAKAGVGSVAFIQGEVNGEMRKDLLNKVRTKQLQVLVGSSLPYDEFIWIKDQNKKISLIRIGEFVETSLNTQIEAEFQTLSFWQNKICWKKITHVVRHEKHVPILRTTVGTTRCVSVTSNHSLITLEDNRQKKVEPKQGNTVIVATNLPLNSKKIKQFDLVKEFSRLKNRKVEIWLDRNQKEINLNLTQANIRKIKSEYKYLMNLLDKKIHYKIGKRLENKSLYYKAFVLWFNENVKFYKGKFRTTFEKILLFKDYKKISATINWRRSRKKFSLPLFLDNSKELSEICGMLIGDGAVNASWRLFLSAKPNEHFVYKNAKSRKANTVDLMVKNLKLLFPSLDVVVTPGRGCCFGGQLISMLFRDILGVIGKALTKKVPNYIFNSNTQIQMAFLYGYFLTDGSFDGDHQFVFGSVSKELTDGVVGILLANGFNKIKYSVVPPDLKPRNQKDIITRNYAFRVSVVGNLFGLGRHVKMGSRSYLRDEIEGQFYILPIIRTEEQVYDRDVVYDISVEESENFFSGQGILCHNTVADEGVDIPALGSAIMAGGGKSLIKSLQRVGRTLRPYPSAENNEKKEAIIVDFYDRIRYLTGHSKKRMQIYESEPRFKVLKHF